MAASYTEVYSFNKPSREKIALLEVTLDAADTTLDLSDECAAAWPLATMPPAAKEADGVISLSAKQNASTASTLDLLGLDAVNAEAAAFTNPCYILVAYVTSVD